MAKWDITVVGSYLKFTLNTNGGEVEPQSITFREPSYHEIQGGYKFFESGIYVKKFLFGDIGDVTGVTPTDDADLKVKIDSALANFNWGGISPTSTSVDVLSRTSNFTNSLINSVKDLSIIILSDSTGDQADEWAYIFSNYLKTLNTSYTVNFRFWDSGSLIYSPIEVLQVGTGAEILDIYVGGASGQGIAYGDTNFDALFPITPDLVMISYGHNDNYANSQLYKTQYLKLTRKIRQSFVESQLILLAQNPKADTELTFENGVKNAYDIANICGAEGYGFINVMQQFFDYGDYATDLLADGTHPNAEGSQFWADVIIKAFPKINYSGSSFPRNEQETIFVPANQLYNYNAGTIDTIFKSGDVAIPFIPLSDILNSSISSSIILPNHWKTINIYVLWQTPTDATGSNVYFNSYSYFLDDSVSAPTLGGGAFVISAGGVSGKVMKTQIYSYFGGGEYQLEKTNIPFTYSVTRLASDINDTYTGDCQVLGVLFERKL